MKSSIYDYADYKVYVRSALETRSGLKRGERSRLAEAVGCHTAYVSQVLNGDAHFSLEQGEQVGRFLGLSGDQTRYFLLLIQRARAGTATLRRMFEEELSALKEKQFVLKDRLEFKRALSREDQATFYSSWHYGAIHVLVSVPGCHTERGMADYLGLPASRVAEVLGFLTEVGLVDRRADKYVIGTTHIHLEHDSPMISKHHANWRLQALRSLDLPGPRDLHYSSVVTVSRADADRVREALVRAIEDVRAIVRPSPSEEGFCYAIDFFGLQGGGG
jgi:uncharacterized protein (TIGR02147 family)